jgi:hypothetical protein
MHFRFLIILIAMSLSAPSAQAQGGFLSLVSPNAQSAERRAERKLERAERQAARKTQRAERQAARKMARLGDAGMVNIGRPDLKERVHLATMNRPKGRLWCVPFARNVTGVSLRGNAKTWWQGAKGKYERSKTPKIGAIMSFAASRAMPQGHVAVVSKVIGPRQVLLDHANWERNRITLDQLAVDVSANNDWSKVRVQHQGGAMGRVNPVNGFIYKAATKQ